MSYFLQDEAYKVGLILKEEENSKLHFGLGYLQVSSKFSQFSKFEVIGTNSLDEDGVLFFLLTAFKMI
ncbi:MAG TPA: hypothetical protein EYO73_06430 [Sulfurimonas sp.]|nr:hypothetical protein [Sulfurimonas sp.]